MLRTSEPKRKRRSAKSYSHHLMTLCVKKSGKTISNSKEGGKQDLHLVRTGLWGAKTLLEISFDKASDQAFCLETLFVDETLLCETILKRDTLKVGQFSNETLLN